MINIKKPFALYGLCLAMLMSLAGCATSQPGAYRLLPNQQFEKINPAKISTSASAVYQLGPQDVLLIKVEPLPALGGSYKIDKGNVLKVTFNQAANETYRVTAGDLLSLEFPDEIEGAYELLVAPDGTITLPKLGRRVTAAGKTVAAIARSTQKYYDQLFVSASLSWGLVKPFNDRMYAMNGEYQVGADGDIAIPNLGRINLTGKSATVAATILSNTATKKFNNAVEASVSIATNIMQGQPDSRVTPSGLQMYTNLNNLPTTVSDNGEVYVPNVGLVVAEGKTVHELTKTIEEKLQPKYQNPIAVNVAIQQYADYTVFIGGEVRVPGRYPFSRRLTMLKLIAQAGWVNEYGDLGSALLLRAEGSNHYTVYRTNLDEIFKGEGLDGQDLKVSPQDLIVVPPTSIAKTNRFITQYVRGILPFGTSVSYNINTDPRQR